MPALKKLAASLSEDEKIGVEIVMKALTSPLRQIAENAGKEGSIIIQKIAEMGTAFGYDAKTDIFCDMFEKGIVDPTKVVRCSIQFAASVAALLLTTEAIITDEKEEEKAAMHSMHS